MDYELLHGLERHFLNLEDLGPQDKEFNIMLKLGNGICWALKFRHAGLLYNRLDLVLADCIACDGTLTIRDVATFHHMMIGETTFDEELKNDRMKLQTSSPEIAQALKARFHGALSTSSSSSAMYSSHTTAPSSSSMGYAPSSSSSSATSTTNTTTAPSSSSSSSMNATGTLSSSSSSSAMTTNHPSGSMRDCRAISSGDTAPPLKTGWLLKKRDIISGWKCRYFEVHMDRLDYFESPDDVRPRGSYLLHQVDVSSVKPIRTKRKSEHYGLFLQLHAPEKTIKLASDKTGLEGRVEADAWYQVFTMIARHHKARMASGTTSTTTAAAAAAQNASSVPPPPPEFSNSPGGQRLTPKRVAYTPTTPATIGHTTRPSALATTTTTTTATATSKKTLGHKFARFMRRITGRRPTNSRRLRGPGASRSGSSSGGNTPTGAPGHGLRGKKKSMGKLMGGQDGSGRGGDGFGGGGAGDGVGGGAGLGLGGGGVTGKSGMARSGVRAAGDAVSATQILAYGGGIVALTVALIYAWWVTKSISTKTFVTLAVLMGVLMAIFVQEFILDDEDDDDEDEEDGEVGDEGEGDYDENGEYIGGDGDGEDDGDGLREHDSFDHGDHHDEGEEGVRGIATTAVGEMAAEDDDDEEEDLDTDAEDDVPSDEEAYAAAKARPPKGQHHHQHHHPSQPGHAVGSLAS